MSSSPRLTPPADLISSIHSELVSRLRKSKYDMKLLKQSGVLGAGPIDKLTAAFETARHKVDHFIRHCKLEDSCSGGTCCFLVVGGLQAAYIK